MPARLVALTVCLFSFYSTASDVIECQLGRDVNDCIAASTGSVVRLAPGVHETSGIRLRSNSTLIIPSDSTLRLSDKAQLNPDAFGGVVNALVLAKGTPSMYLENVHIVVDGAIDGNKAAHPYEAGGCEAINLAYIKDSSITGSGVIHSANGDGIDIDAAERVVIDGVTVRDNDGSGIHFGSPRPIIGSQNNLVIGVKSYSNGFKHGRNGFDLSWPNPHGAVFMNCTAIDNFRNFEIEASGGVVTNCRSESSGAVVAEDDFSGASYAYVNDKDVTDPAWISKKTTVLLNRDIKKLLGMEYHEYLEGIEY